ncbi:hypothetical protein MHB43_21515 [Paenibacillus sp. FSL H8-0317]|uniref:hypothetical protein n=1 Tax=Paenibacillus sp. FSL H8-0317 TaxID=2921385 RepID=UPI0032477F65
MKRFKGVLCLVLTLVIGFTLTATETQAASKKVSLKISNGGTYYGEVRNGKPHGMGTATWGDYKTYSGEWKHGKRSGNGKFTEYLMSDAFKDGDRFFNLGKEVYTGEWLNDKKSGHGTLTFYFEWRSEDPVREVKKGNFNNNKLIQGYVYSYNEGFNSETFYTSVDGDVVKNLKYNKQFYSLKKAADELTLSLPTKIKEKFNDEGLLN